MSLQYIKDVANIKFDKNKCIGCGMCLDVCPHEVFAMTINGVVLEKKDNCIECGACSKNCPVEAIEVKAGVG
ncbi:4Fe-4S dicluster domain-containing protein [Natronincola peptidivorans]|uniref:4Fe-4S dicluster domain-containing protein n=1 Tax=Natronincola peptidivorans TaxID=426128 RepID=A0A1I0C9V5_9FIRM|nr:4Fe-4S dicluster domain-containing protein [Natronincola peptidivorans]SET16250.1 4Fe-4S dicluster domain-containing protein [Natronincola peptidivorans]